jgi:CRISPR-associated protein Csx14
MSKNLLVTALGTSPAVVTEALDLLKEQRLPMDGVLLITPDDYDVRSALELLQSHLPSHDGITWINPISAGAFADIDSAEAAVSFLEVAGTTLQTYRDAGYHLFVSVAGGRKSMAGLLTLAVQFYGADRLFHIWVPPWIEEEGDINKLRPYASVPDELTRRLHPPLGAPEGDRPRLVDLPFIGLFPLLPEIRAALAGKHASREVRELLTRNGLIAQGGATTELGDKVLDVLGRVEALPPARQEPCSVSISDHHYKTKLETFANQLANRFSFIKEIRSAAWSSGDARVAAEEPDRLHVQVLSRSGPTLGLTLVTTASTPGQLQAAERAVERFVRQSGLV